MRIFLHNVDTFLGKALVKELRRDERGLNRIFGSVTAPGRPADFVKKLYSRDDPKKAQKMKEKLQSVRVIIMDLFSCTLEDLQFAISALKVDIKASPPRITGELEQEVTFILISSVMVWADTQLAEVEATPAPADPDDPEAAEAAEAPPPDPEPGGALREAHYAHRKPAAGSKYEQWREMEDMIMECFSIEGSQVKAVVVAPGVLYGDGEETLSNLFKDAWLGAQTHSIVTPGTNRIPMIHVRDMARLVRQIAYKAELSPKETPYFLAVDKGPAPTQAEVIHGIVGEVNGSKEVPMVEPDPAAASSAEPADDTAEVGATAGAATGAVAEDAETLQLRNLTEAMALDLNMEPSSLMLDEETFGMQSDPPGWFCNGGFLANIRKVAEEFCKERELRAMRAILSGPPGSGKSTLARMVSEHFNIQHLELNDKDLDATAKELNSEVCRYRGYVLDAGIAGFKEVEKLFRYDFELPPDEDEDAGGGGDEEEDAEAPKAPKVERRLNEALVPEFAIMLQAPEDFCRARWNARATETPEQFQDKMARYRAANLDPADSYSRFSDFFQEKDLANIGVFNLPVAGKDAEDIFESVRIYMESKGRPFNYLKTADEVAEELLAKKVEEEETKAEQAIAEQKRQAGDDVSKGEVSKRHLERMKIIAAHEAQRREIEALPLREYLMRYMVPNLTEGLIEMCKVLPENPTDYLASYLEQHSASEHSEN